MCLMNLLRRFNKATRHRKRDIKQCNCHRSTATRGKLGDGYSSGEGDDDIRDVPASVGDGDW